VVMRNVLRKRESEGKPHCNLAVFVHGTALKMFAHEKGGQNPVEFPPRFLPWMKEQRVWDDVDVCFAISEQQVDALTEIFPEFPRERIVVSPNGINQSIFHPIEGVSISNLLPQLSPVAGSVDSPAPLPGEYDKVVVFVGKFANWKRIDAVLGAAAV